MCELLAMSFDAPATAAFTIREFGPRGEENADGWGLAWYPDTSVAVIKEPVKWGDSPLAGFCETYANLTSRIFIGHVRDATAGLDRRHANTHPFSRELMGRDYTFAHNGTLLDPVYDLPIGPATPMGDTDSERAFCHLLKGIQGRGRHLDGPVDWSWLHWELAAINALGKLNAILSDGVRLFVYRDLKAWKGLSYLVGPSSGRLGDAPMSVDVDATGGRRVVVATRALGPGDWTAMEPGEMLVVEAGAIRRIDRADAAISA